MGKLFHVETQRADGEWRTWTENPIEGEEAAEEHLAMMRSHYVEQDPAKMRLHELTDEEVMQMTIARLTPEERDNIVANHIRSMPPGEFWRHVAEEREKARLAAKIA